MSHDDNHRPDSRDRGAYTPPTDDDLPFNRGGGFDARRAPPAKAPPVTLIISGLVLLAMIVAVVVIYNLSGPKPSQDAPAIGSPVGNLKVEAPVEAQPVDAEAGIDVYRDEAEVPGTAPTFTPPPEVVQPRPEPRPLPAPPVAVAPKPTPAPVPRPAAPAVATPAPAVSTATGTSAVQIGAFSSTAIADREFAAVAARYPQFTRGSAKRVQEVTASNGSTVYRTTFTGLSRERAQAFCAAIRAAGDDCLVR